jgi:hypothetical protein
MWRQLHPDSIMSSLRQMGCGGSLRLRVVGIALLGERCKRLTLRRELRELKIVTVQDSVRRGDLFQRLSHRQTLCNQSVRGRIEGHADVRTRHFEIYVGVFGHTATPIHDAIVAGINRSLKN